MCDLREIFALVTIVPSRCPSGLVSTPAVRSRSMSLIQKVIVQAGGMPCERPNLAISIDPRRVNQTCDSGKYWIRRITRLDHKRKARSIFEAQ